MLVGEDLRADCLQFKLEFFNVSAVLLLGFIFVGLSF